MLSFSRVSDEECARPSKNDGDDDDDDDSFTMLPEYMCFGRDGASANLSCSNTYGRAIHPGRVVGTQMVLFGIPLTRTWRGYEIYSRMEPFMKWILDNMRE